MKERPNLDPKNKPASEDPGSASEVGSRIKAMVELLGGRAAAAAAADVSPEQVTRYISGKSQPTLPPLANLAAAANVNLNWLAYGRGSMLLDDDGPQDAFAYIPRYKVNAAAGAGSENHDESSSTNLAFRKDWLTKELGIPSRRLVVITARGDSMEPTIRSGAILLVDVGQPELQEDGVYVLQSDHHLQVKRLQRGPGGQVIIKSDNLAYQPMTITEADKDSFRIVGRVVWSGGSL